MPKRLDIGSQQEIRSRIVSEYLNGAHPTFLSDKYDCHIKSIYRMVRVYRRRHTCIRKSGSGRPPMLNKTEKIRILNIIRYNPFITTDKIRDKLGKTISIECIRIYIHSLGYLRKKLIKKPILSEAHKINRLDWAKTHRTYDFGRLIFSDETSIWLVQEAPTAWIKRGDVRYFHGDNHSAKVHVHGSISIFGKVSLQVFTGNMDSTKYCEILQTSLIPEANKVFGGDYWVLQQDNAPTHKSNFTQEFLEKKYIEVLPWPAKSPDLNPIENIWGLLKRKVRERTPKTQEELKKVILEEWEKFPNDIIIKTFISIDNRIESIIKNNGDSIDY